jgi:alkylation response protein AidB-like acyl-CoA dehydrogenase
MKSLIAARAPFPASNVNLYVVGPTLCKWGTDEQKRRYLPPLLRADELWCQGFSEPNAGSDLASLKTSARRDGADFVVNGQKIWTSQAHHAHFCALMARTEEGTRDHRGISYMIVDMRTPGLTVRPIQQITGDAEFNELFFEDVRVPATNLIGALNDGWNVAMKSLSSERSAIIVQRQAEAESIFQELLDALRPHVASGGALSAATIARIGHARVHLAALEAQVCAMVARLGEGHALPGLESIDKLLLTEVEQEVFALVFDMLGPWRQAAGGRPFGLDADRITRDFFYSRSRSISGGTTQIQRNIVAQRVLGLPR